MAYATATQYANRLAITLTPTKELQVTELLDDATELVDANLPAAGWTPPAGLAKAIVCAIVRRAVANTGGVRQKTVGQTSESYGEKGGLYITDEEIRDLKAAYEQQVGDDVDSFTLLAHDPGLPPHPGWR